MPYNCLFYIIKLGLNHFFITSEICLDKERAGLKTNNLHPIKLSKHYQQMCKTRSKTQLVCSYAHTSSATPAVKLFPSTRSYRLPRPSAK